MKKLINIESYERVDYVQGAGNKGQERIMSCFEVLL
jgi:hypothetical protein